MGCSVIVKNLLTSDCVCEFHFKCVAVCSRVLQAVAVRYSAVQDVAQYDFCFFSVSGNSNVTSVSENRCRRKVDI